jgi:hypothetical protein
MELFDAVLPTSLLVIAYLLLFQGVFPNFTARYDTQMELES